MTIKVSIEVKQFHRITETLKQQAHNIETFSLHAVMINFDEEFTTSFLVAINN